jgi:catechol 2,3-dioxygenase-like lactoylglutathione lyase family enzyme
VSADVGDLHLATVVINTSDMRRGVDFWCAALGYQPRESTWNAEFTMLQEPEGRGLPVSLQLTEPDHLQPCGCIWTSTRASRSGTSAD